MDNLTVPSLTLTHPLKRSYIRNETPQPDRTITRSLSNYNSKSTSKNGSILGQRGAKLDVDSLLLNIRRLMDHYYKDEAADGGYWGLVMGYLRERLEGDRKKLDQHLNKISFMEESMYKRNYGEIETEILSEWRKSPILYSLRSLWYSHITKFSLKTFSDFQAHDRKFVEFIAQLAYLYFGNFFKALENRSTGRINALEKLMERSGHFIITATSSWSKLYEGKVKGLLARQLPNTIELKGTFDTGTLQLTSLAINPQEEASTLKSTQCQLRLFLSQSRLPQKVAHLLSIRSSLETQIKCYQKSLIEKKQLKGYKVLDKDDFIGCLIVCVVEGGVKMKDLGLGVRIIEGLMGEDAELVLGAFGANSYLTDLGVAYQYLLNWCQENGGILEPKSA